MYFMVWFCRAVDPSRNCSVDNVCEQQCVRNITSSNMSIEVCSCMSGFTLVQLHTKLPIVFVQFWVQGLALLALHSSTSADRMESHLQPLNQHNVFVHIRTCAISHVRVQCKSTHTGTHLNTHIGWSDVYEHIAVRRRCQLNSFY